jgi:hypothetical protein
VHAVLQLPEVGPAVVAEGHDLAVEDQLVWRQSFG